MCWAKRDHLDPSTLPTRLKEPLRISVVVDTQSRVCLSFSKNSVSDSVWAEKKKIGLFIPFILLTLLKVSLRRLRMSSRETIRLPFSSNWTGPVMPAISTLKKEEKQWLWLNLHEKVGISLKRVLVRTLFSGTENDFSDADAVQIFGDKLLLKSK